MRLNLRWAEIPFPSSLLGPSCLGEGHAHVCAGTPQIQGNALHPSPTPALKGVRLELHQHYCRPLRVLWPGVGEAPGVAYPGRGADNTKKGHQGHSGQVLHPWEQRDDASLGSVCRRGHLLLKESGMNPKEC